MSNLFALGQPFESRYLLLPESIPAELGPHLVEQAGRFGHGGRPDPGPALTPSPGIVLRACLQECAREVWDPTWSHDRFFADLSQGGLFHWRAAEDDESLDVGQLAWQLRRLVETVAGTQSAFGGGDATSPWWMTRAFQERDTGWALHTPAGAQDLARQLAETELMTRLRAIPFRGPDDPAVRALLDRIATLLTRAAEQELWVLGFE